MPNVLFRRGDEFYRVPEESAQQALEAGLARSTEGELEEAKFLHAAKKPYGTSAVGEAANVLYTGAEQTAASALSLPSLVTGHESGSALLAELFALDGSGSREEWEKSIKARAGEHRAAATIGQVTGMVAGGKGLGALAQGAGKVVPAAARGLQAVQGSRAAGVALAAAEGGVANVMFAREDAWMQDKEFTRETILADGALGAALSGGLSLAAPAISRLGRKALEKATPRVDRFDQLFKKRLAPTISEEMLEYELRAPGQAGRRLVQGSLDKTDDIARRARAERKFIEKEALGHRKAADEYQKLGDEFASVQDELHAARGAPGRARDVAQLEARAKEVGGRLTEASKRVDSRRLAQAEELSSRLGRLEEGLRAAKGTRFGGGFAAGVLAGGGGLPGLAGAHLARAAQERGAAFYATTLKALREKHRAVAKLAAEQAVGKRTERVGTEIASYLTHPVGPSAFGAGELLNWFEGKKAALDSATRDIEGTLERVNGELGDLRNAAPTLSAQTSAQAYQAAAWLQQQAPSTEPLHTAQPDGPKRQPPRGELERFWRITRAAENPWVIYDDLAKGNLSPDTVQTVKTIYPTVYTELQSAALEAIRGADLKKMPWKNQVALDSLLGGGGVVAHGYSPGFLMRQRTVLEQVVEQSQAAPPPPRGKAPSLAQQYRTVSSSTQQSTHN